MVRDILRNAAGKLKASETPMLDARVLLAAAMQKSSAELIFDAPSPKQLALFDKYINMRCGGIPVAYILGKKEFMGYNFFLNRDTLIPRPDTECLVEKVLQLNTFDSPFILDLCTGSGCIGISLALKIHFAKAVLTDISDGALSASQKNVVYHSLSNRVTVEKLDIMNDTIKNKYDIITANPPYIKSAELSRLKVSKSEPRLALDGGSDGLDFYKVIVNKAFKSLSVGGLLAMEIGFDQADALKKMMSSFSDVTVTKDYGGNDRVVTGYKR